MSAMIRVMPGQTRSAAQTHRSHMKCVRNEDLSDQEQTTIVPLAGADVVCDPVHRAKPTAGIPRDYGARR